MSSTIGRERATNPALLISNVDDFIAFATADLPPAPAYFANVVRLNRCGAALLTSVVDTARRRLSVPDFDREMRSKAGDAADGTAPLVLDARITDDFAAGHIPGSMSISVGEVCDVYNFALWVRACHSGLRLLACCSRSLCSQAPSVNRWP
jgi:hydroxyacylglutathione hydrolase